MKELNFDRLSKKALMALETPSIIRQKQLRKKVLKLAKAGYSDKEISVAMGLFPNNDFINRLRRRDPVLGHFLITIRNKQKNSKLIDWHNGKATT